MWVLLLGPFFVLDSERALRTENDELSNSSNSCLVTKLPSIKANLTPKVWTGQAT